MDQIRLIIVDDHPLVRDSIGLLMAKEAEFSVISSCATADECLQAARASAPDAVLMDIEMPGSNVFQIVREHLRLGLKCRFVFLSAFLTDAYLQEVLHIGQDSAVGYLLKTAPISEITHAIRTVVNGKSYLAAAALARLPEHRQGAVSRLGLLTPREREVLQLVASDLSCKQIAGKLGLSIRTVDRHKANIMEKLDIHSQVGLTRFALAEGVCDPRSWT